MVESGSKLPHSKTKIMLVIRGKRVVVTGGAGFLGRAVVATLQGRGCGAVFASRKREYDLTDRANSRRLFQDLLQAGWPTPQEVGYFARRKEVWVQSQGPVSGRVEEDD